ncbi:MAG: PLP-dependent aminotransferase family protein [Alphaproteobacteria bacterium]|nr:PLP-dependent aminotransferase family protein [Alphaproteobacteria bacterium]
MFKELLPLWIKNLEKSGVQKALETTANPDIISFSLGRPDNNLLRLPELKDCYEELFSPHNLQYSPPSYELKAHIAEFMKEKQVVCTPKEILLTTGAQQAMTLLTKLFANEGADILVDQLTYPGFIQVAQSMHLNLIPSPLCFQSGLHMKELRQILEKNARPSLMYTISEGHNPLGTSLSKKQRIELTALAKEYKVPIIEDDAYGFLNYDLVDPPLKSYSKEGVFYIGSFSKILAPSMRTGWIIASEPIIEKLEILKEGLDINTTSFSQKLITSCFEKGILEERILKLRGTYKEKRDVMVYSLQKYIPEMEFTIPKSGFFIWGKLPSSINTKRLFKFALEEEKVSFIPGNAFLVGERDDVQNCLRLSFAFCPIELIELGIKRLSIAIQSYKWQNEEQYLRLA